MIAAAGPPGLAERRAAAISGELLRYGIVASTLTLDTVPANRAIVAVGRYTVTLPACPNWSQSLAAEFTNAFTSNYGCANATNLGLMVASPADLVSGRTLAPADGQPAVAAVERYMNDRVKPPPAPTASPFAASTGGGGSGGGAPVAEPEPEREPELSNEIIARFGCAQSPSARVSSPSSTSRRRSIGSRGSSVSCNWMTSSRSPIRSTPRCGASARVRHRASC